MKQTSLKKLLEKIRDISLEHPLSIHSQLADAEKKIIGRLGGGREEAPEGLEQTIGRMIEQRLGDKQEMQGGIEDFITHKIIFAAYDKNEARIRKYIINSLFYSEDSSFETIIGSGADSAELELMKLMPGVKLKGLQQPEIAFFALCAYVRATQNIGVGGMPKIAFISRGGTYVIRRSDSIALANITSAYQAEHVNRAFAEQAVRSIAAGKADYEETAGKLGMTASSMCRLLVPLDSWLYDANARRYGKTASAACKCGRKCRNKAC